MNWLREEAPRQPAWTIGGAVICIEGGEAVVMREFGRGGIDALSLGSAEPLSGRFKAGMEWPVVFDGRFVVEVGRAHC